MTVCARHERTKKSIEAKLEALTEKANRWLLTFDKLGIDG